MVRRTARAWAAGHVGWEAARAPLIAPALAVIYNRRSWLVASARPRRGQQEAASPEGGGQSRRTVLTRNRWNALA